MQNNEDLEWEIQDLESAEELIDKGYSDLGVYKLANMLYNKRMEQKNK